MDVDCRPIGWKGALNMVYRAAAEVNRTRQIGWHGRQSYVHAAFTTALRRRNTCFDGEGNYRAYGRERSGANCAEYAADSVYSTSTLYFTL
jgi:hypothetical protein